MSSRPFKSKILHKETLQNANQEVEVIIRTKPKFSHSDKPKPKPFVRNCHLKKALDKISEESGEQISSPSPARKTLGYQTRKIPRTTVEISKRKPKKNATSNAADETWADVLSKYSCDINEDEVDERAMSKRSHREKSAKLNRLEATSRSKYEFNIHDHKKIKDNLENFEHNRKTIESFNAKDMNPIERIKPNNDKLPNAQTLINQQTNGTNNQQENVETPQNQVQDGRLYSDGISSTPFSDSALKLLEQLKVKLAKRGDDGSNEVLGVIEHCLSVGQQSPMLQMQLNNAHSSVFGNSFNSANLNDDARAKLVKNSKYDDHQKKIAELEAENARQAVVISELRVLGARMLSQMKQPNDVAPSNSERIPSNPSNIEKVDSNSTRTRVEVSKGLSNSSNKENEFSGEERAAVINNNNPLSKYGNTADYEKKELRVALLQSEMDNEMLRKQLNILQVSQQSGNSAKPPILSNRNNEVDSAFSSNLPSKHPSPSHTSGQNSASPSLVVINEDIRENVGTLTGTASTKIDVAMFAETNEIDRLRVLESNPHQNSLTVIPTLPQQENPVMTRNKNVDASVQSYVLHSHHCCFSEDLTGSSFVETDHSNISSRSELEKQPVKMVRSYEDRVLSQLNTNDSNRYCGSRNRPQFSLNSSSIKDAAPNNIGARRGFPNSSVELSNLQVYESTRMNNASELTALPVEEDSCSIPS